MSQPLQDSITLDHYYHISKRETIAHKKTRKQEEVQRPTRKCSTQMSIVTWLHQGSAQHCKITTLDKSLILKVFGYLRLSELVVASSTCAYFSSCYRSLWIDKQFFGQLQTDKLTSAELGEVIKVSKLDHIKQLKQIYSGKNIRFCREKIKIKAGNGGSVSGGMLQIFSVTPKNQHSGSSFILDSHLSQIISSSFRCLKVIELVKCSLLRDFLCLSRCIELSRLVISYNDNLRNQDLGMICKRCTNLEQIHLQACRGLDENAFEHLQFVEMLTSLELKSFRQSFGKLKKLSNNSNLTKIDLNGSMINDMEACQLIQLKNLTFLSIRNCGLLTDIFIDWLIKQLPKTKLKQVRVEGCNLDEEKVQKLYSLLPKNQSD